MPDRVTRKGECREAMERRWSMTSARASRADGCGWHEGDVRGDA